VKSGGRVARVFRNPWFRYGGGGGLAAAGAALTPIAPWVGIPMSVTGASILTGGNIASDLSKRDEQTIRNVVGILNGLTGMAARMPGLAGGAASNAAKYTSGTTHLEAFEGSQQ
jgi:hypothetical protein